MRNTCEEKTVDASLKNIYQLYVITPCQSSWWQPIYLKGTPVQGEVGPTKYITRPFVPVVCLDHKPHKWFPLCFFLFLDHKCCQCARPDSFAITSFIRRQWRRCGCRSSNPTASKASAPPDVAKMKSPAQAWFGISHALIVSRVMNGLRCSHSQARPKTNYLTGSFCVRGEPCFRTGPAHSSFLTREMAINHKALWNSGGGGGWWSIMFPLLRREGEPQFRLCWMSHVACFLLSLPPGGKTSGNLAVRLNIIFTQVKH